jgi:hypothetical protein
MSIRDEVSIPSTQKGEAGPVEEGSRRYGFNVGQHPFGVGRKREEKSGQENDGRDYLIS